MRMAFGLLGLLVCIGVIVWIMSAVELPSAQNAVNVQKKVKPQVQQIAGVDTDGTDARDSIKLDADTTGGKMKSVVVTQVTSGGAMERYFGLQKGDSIIEIAMAGGAMMPVQDMASPAEAKDSLLSSFQNSQQIVVMREGKKMTLPVAPVKNPATPAASPATPAGSSVQKQLEGITQPR